MTLSFKIQYVKEVLSEPCAQKYLSREIINSLQDILTLFLESCSMKEEKLNIPVNIMYQYKNLLTEHIPDIGNISDDCSTYVREFYYVFEKHRQHYILITLGKSLKQVRENKKLTLFQIAERLWVPYHYIQELEEGIENHLNLFQILELANLLEIDSLKIWETLTAKHN
ncbi:helix-turn-helix domain-containing protein [Cellulosilyticum sp. ST5]|uniref:helix-turn-helix domain-containing protein n=1 Tax=Cellulosilyticum sp. ST5 TaxID=3055805 RepID=UPI0039774A5D